MLRKKETKPILVVRFPIGSVTSRQIEEIAFEDLQKKMMDYHVIGLRDNSVSRVEFECYNSPHSEIEFSELRELVLECLKEAKKNEDVQNGVREKALEEMMRLDQEMGLYDHESGSN